MKEISVIAIRTTSYKVLGLNLWGFHSSIPTYIGNGDKAYKVMIFIRQILNRSRLGKISLTDDWYEKLNLALWHYLNHHFPYQKGLDDCFWGINQMIAPAQWQIWLKEYKKEKKLARKEARRSKQTHSVRWLTNSPNVIFVTPSGKKMTGRLRSTKKYALLEPSKSNTAAYVIETKYLTDDNIDLRTTPHQRFIHHRAGQKKAFRLLKDK